MTSEMIERVARAIRPALSFDAPVSLSHEAARAAIDAMREPTKGMIEVGRNAIGSDFDHWAAPDDTWRTMIDAALEETP